MESPLKNIIEWYESLPVTQRQDIGAIIGISCPGFGDLSFFTELDDIPKKFISALGSHSNTFQKEVGMVLLVRSAIEFFFIRKRSDRNSWKETEEMLRKLAKEKSSETFEQSANKKQFEGHQWLATCKKWSLLKEQFLNDKYLEIYQLQQNL